MEEPEAAQEDVVMQEAEESDDSIEEPLSATASPLPKAPSPPATKKRRAPSIAPQPGKRHKSVSKPRISDQPLDGEALALRIDQSTWQERDESAPKRVLPTGARFKSLKKFQQSVKVDLKPDTDEGWKLEVVGQEQEWIHYECNWATCPFKVK